MVGKKLIECLGKMMVDKNELEEVDRDEKCEVGMKRNKERKNMRLGKKFIEVM